MALYRLGAVIVENGRITGEQDEHDTELTPLSKSALEYGPVLKFFVAYLRSRTRRHAFWGTDYSGSYCCHGGLVPL